MWNRSSQRDAGITGTEGCNENYWKGWENLRGVLSLQRTMDWECPPVTLPVFESCCSKGKRVPHPSWESCDTKLLWLHEQSKKRETTTKIKGKNLKIYAKWLNQNVYHRSSLSWNIAENKDSLWRGGKIIGEQEISREIYEDVAEFLCQFYSLDLVSPIIARREAKHKLFMTV